MQMGPTFCLYENAENPLNDIRGRLLCTNGNDEIILPSLVYAKQKRCTNGRKHLSKGRGILSPRVEGVEEAVSF